ncbi:hypothetical protein DRQ36_00115 [bacterium]|nr:MAG: hypothetical protein DRQ36_00115 [bacterium]
MQIAKNISTTIVIAALFMSCASKKPKTANNAQSENRKIAASLILSDSAYVLGSEIEFLMTVTSLSEKTIELTFPTACKSRFVVSRDDHPIWNSLEGIACAQTISHTTLAPGDTARFRAVWDCTSISEKGIFLGKYEAKAFLLSSPPVETENATFYLVD